MLAQGINLHRRQQIDAALGGASWTPEKLLSGQSPLLWLRADDIAGGDGDAVAAWNDKSSSGNNYAQAVADSQPALKTGANGIGSQNGVLFDGTADHLLGSNFSSATSGTAIAVFRLSASPSVAQTVFSSSNEDGVNFFYRLVGYYDTTNQGLVCNQKSGDTQDVVAGDSIAVAGNNYVAVWSSSGTAYSMRLNGIAQTLTVSSGANNGDWLGDTLDRDNTVIGAMKRTTVGGYFKGLLCELLLYGTPLSTPDIARVEAYLKGRYGINF